MNQTNKKKLEKVIAELEKLKNDLSQPLQILDKECVKDIRSKQDLDNARAKLKEYSINTDTQEKIEKLKQIVEDMQYDYEDKAFSADFDSPRYDTYDSISSDLDSANSELEDILEAIEESENEAINDKLDEIEETLEELDFQLRDLQYEIELRSVGNDSPLKSYIDSAISSIKGAMHS